jgi:hypothetical protein
MSAREQESKIAQVRQQLQQFNQSGSDQANNDGILFFFRTFGVINDAVTNLHAGNDADSSEDDSSSSEEE